MRRGCDSSLTCWPRRKNTVVGPAANGSNGLEIVARLVRPALRPGMRLSCRVASIGSGATVRRTL